MTGKSRIAIMDSLWLVLGIFLLAISLGAKNFLGLILASLIFVAGAIVTLTGLSLSPVNKSVIRTLRNVRHFWTGLRLGGVVKVTHEDEDDVAATRIRWAESSLTGSELIDEPLNSILSYVFRDYIYPWHFKLTHRRAFPVHLQDSVRVLASNLSHKIKGVDWIPYLTTRLVDDVASHVRLFKKARLHLRLRNRDLTGGENSGGGSSGKIVDLESVFFDAEVAMETNLCRDLASSIQQEELNYLQSISDILLFLLLPEEDFIAIPLRSLAREILVNTVLKPTLDLLSDPDFINQTLVWLHQDYKIKNELFIASIRCSENMEELTATRENVMKEISFIRSNDSKGELDSSLKAQLNSLLYLKKVIDGRIHRIQSGSETDSMGIPAHVDWNQMIGPGLALFDLPIDVILKNNIALSYFIDYMTSIGCQSYLFFYLNIEGWKVSAETQIQALALEDLHLKNTIESAGSGSNAAAITELQKKAATQKSALHENMREAAHSIYEEYLSEKANPRLKIDESVVKRLLFKIRTEPPDADWFDESQVAIFDKLTGEDRFLNSFKKSVGYVKLLAELDLLKDPTSKSECGEDDEDDAGSLSGGEELSIYDSNSLQSGDSLDPNDLKANHARHRRQEQNNIFPISRVFIAI